MLVELLKLLSFVLIDFLFLTILLLPSLAFVYYIHFVSTEKALR